MLNVCRIRKKQFLSLLDRLIVRLERHQVFLKRKDKPSREASLKVKNQYRKYPQKRKGKSKKKSRIQFKKLLRRNRRYSKDQKAIELKKTKSIKKIHREQIHKKKLKIKSLFNKLIP